MQRSSTMTDATHFYVQRLLTQLSSECASAQARIWNARTMREVEYASNLRADPMIRSLAETRKQLHEVHNRAETRIF
jgi:hypothetical protein